MEVHKTHRERYGSTQNPQREVWKYTKPTGRGMEVHKTHRERYGSTQNPQREVWKYTKPTGRGMAVHKTHRGRYGSTQNPQREVWKYTKPTEGGMEVHKTHRERYGSTQNPQREVWKYTKPTERGMCAKHHQPDEMGRGALELCTFLCGPSSFTTAALLNSYRKGTIPVPLRALLWAAVLPARKDWPLAPGTGRPPRNSLRILWALAFDLGIKHTLNVRCVQVSAHTNDEGVAPRC